MNKSFMQVYGLFTTKTKISLENDEEYTRFARNSYQMIEDHNVLVAEIKRYCQPQKEIADKLGCSNSYFNEIMNGRLKPGPGMIIKMNKFLESQKDKDNGM